MRKITQEAVNAFLSHSDFNSSNTKVVTENITTVENGNGQQSKMYLHGNLVAIKSFGKIEISTAGWNTRTTLDRLNAIPGVDVYIRKGNLYKDDTQWDGSWITV